MTKIQIYRFEMEEAGYFLRNFESAYADLFIRRALKYWMSANIE